MNEDLGGELKSDATSDSLSFLMVFIVISVAILDIFLPIRFWLTMLYLLVGYIVILFFLGFSTSRNPWSKNLKIFKNEVIQFLPKNLGPMFCAYHKESSKLKKIHNSDFVIMYQKELFNIFNFCLQEFIELFYKKLKNGGTCIIFFDLWKIETLKKLMEQIKKTKKGNWSGFKQIRFIEWIKTNPVPVNQSVNYLSNTREVALLGVKKGNPTFNSKFDKGIYQFPIAASKKGVERHPTQKNLQLFEKNISP